LERGIGGEAQRKPSLVKISSLRDFGFLMTPKESNINRKENNIIIKGA